MYSNEPGERHDPRQPRPGKLPYPSRSHQPRARAFLGRRRVLPLVLAARDQRHGHRRTRGQRAGFVPRRVQR